MNHQGLINRYRKFLPLNKSAKVITLYEGQTPLLPLENIPLCLEKNIKIYAKFEGSNPTGSFKDRGMTVAISQAVSEGARAVICLYGKHFCLGSCFRGKSPNTMFCNNTIWKNCLR